MSDTLKRRIGLGLLTAYGVGVMVGAGIYVLVGVVAAAAGIYAPVAFLLAGAVALPSALSYAELTTRIPEAAGEVAYVEQGFRSRPLGIAVGLAVVLAGVISAAAVLRGGAGYLTAIVPLPMTIAIITGGVLLTLVAVAGVLESLAIAALFTVVEVAGLLLVAWAGFAAEPVAAWVAPPPFEMPLVFGAVTLCFFAFIGFEDLANMAEEVRDPERTMPRAIIFALIITAVLYALVSMAAVRAVAQDALGTSDRPLALVWEVATGKGAGFLAMIAVVAAVNGVLAQIVMAARVLLGLGRRVPLLSAFAETGERTGTPVTGTLMVGVAVIGAALLLPVSVLAEVTAAVLLIVFILVNGSLVMLKRKEQAKGFSVPLIVPILGLILSVIAVFITLGAQL